MRKVRCYDCGRSYDFDVDDFCPRCGAFTQPPNTSAIDASGAVVRVDGINERYHAESFVHAELHEEERERKRMGLSKGVRRTVKPVAPARPAAPAAPSARKKPQTPASLAVKIIAAMILLNVIIALVEQVQRLLFLLV